MKYIATAIVLMSMFPFGLIAVLAVLRNLSLRGSGDKIKEWHRGRIILMSLFYILFATGTYGSLSGWDILEFHLEGWMLVRVLVSFVACTVGAVMSITFAFDTMFRGRKNIERHLKKYYDEPEC